MDTAEARTFEPRVVFVDADNRICGTGSDPSEPLPGLISGKTVAAGSGSQVASDW
jgi:aspartate 1-decarboxylase